jgi:Flp pilus assembly protein TadG
MRDSESGARGAVAVEFILLVPVFLALVFGVMDWGHYFTVREVVVNAAREGARAGTLGPGVDPVGAAEAALTRGGVDPSHATISLTTDGATACPSSDSCVFIQYDVQPLTGYLPAPIVPNVTTAAAQMRK